MKNKLNIIFCGSIDEFRDKSWGKTNANFLKHLKENSNVIAVIDYSIYNRIIKAINKLISNLFFGGPTIRNPFLDFFMERKFVREMKEVKVKPDLIVHSNAVCIPESLTGIAKHIQYTDSTLEGIIKYKNSPSSKKSIHVFNAETAKYHSRLAKIFTFNNWTKESLMSDYKIGEDKIENIGFGANLNSFDGEKNYENNLILTVLRRGKEKQKGFDLLLEGFKQARRTNSKLSLAVVGTTAEETEGVTYYENFPREKTIQLFQEASLFAMPALCEPNGMVFIEALACKTPVLGLNRLAFPEFCGYGQYGFITEENAESISKSILEAFTDPSKLKKMGTEGQKFVLEKYDWSIVAKKILKAYEYN